ncbi:MAG: hypothetical protein PHP50_11105 [Lachnospiraceae bacterium]|nr:hypothetical protein [Lachnospiraceae bacterium]
MRIPKDSWAIIERVIRRYPENKRRYDEYMDEIMTSSSGSSTGSNYGEEANKPQSVTEAKALKMHSAYYDRIKKEIAAVEFVYNALNADEQKVVRVRFWSNRWKSIPYLKMKSVSYSETQMRRIAYKVILGVGTYIGELKIK